MPLRLALPLQDGGGVERRGASQLLMRGRRRRDEGVTALAGEESRLDAVHRGGVRPPTETAGGGGGRLPPGTGRPEEALRWRSLRKRGRKEEWPVWALADSWVRPVRGPKVPSSKCFTAEFFRKIEVCFTAFR